MQLNFISNFANEATINIDDVISELRISPATLRNWIKSGLLESVSNKQVTAASFENLKSGALGSTKLISRANKLHKCTIKSDVRDGEENCYDWDYLISLDSENLEFLAANYEIGLSSAFKNEHGIFYTPISIASEMLDSLDFEPANKTFLDPCCGTGNFLIAAIKSGFGPNNIFGSDIDPTATLIAKARVYKLTGYVSDQIIARDFLNYFTDNSIGQKFDFIFTNPPWGKKLSSRLKANISRSFGFERGVDSSAVFAAGCLSLLVPEGTLGLFLPESFFNISSFAEIRAKLLEYDIVSISDHGRAFDGLITKAQSIIVKNQKNHCLSKIICRGEYGLHHRKQVDFKNNPNRIFNFYTTSADARTIDHIFAQTHQTLKDNADWALGIVTGNNGKFIFGQPVDGSIPIHKGSDITAKGIKDATNWILDDFTRFQQVAPMELYMVEEKIAYKFISKRTRFAYDNQKRLFLNSANIIIPKNNFSGHVADISFLLNLKIITWMFERIFNTHKILKSDLEVLPIFLEQLRFGVSRTEAEIYEQLGVEELCDGTFKIKS